MAAEENPVVKAALDLLPMYGVEAWRNNQVRVPGRRFLGKKGVSDVIGMTKSALWVAVELKKPKGKASEDQIEFLDTVRSRGGVAILADSVESLQEALAEAYRAGLFK